MTTEEHILAVAADLLETEGVAAVTTRAVCKAAGVTAPTLYHHFGDKNGLLGAVITQGLNTFMARKRARRQTSDALSDLKRGGTAGSISRRNGRSCSVSSQNACVPMPAPHKKPS